MQSQQNPPSIRINKTILSLAIPNILSNLSVPLLGIVDTLLMGHLESIVYLGAIAIGGMVFNFIYWGFGFLRMGTTGLTAQAYGEQNSKEVILVLSRALTLSLFIALGLILLQLPIALISFYLFNASPEVEQLAQSYFHIRIWAAPATLALYAFHGWFLGIQNVKYPLLLTLVVNIINVIFSLFFVKVWGLQADGVALGTVCAQYIGLLIAIVVILLKYKHYYTRLAWKKSFIPKDLKRFLNVNRDIFIRTLCLVSVFFYFTAKSAEFGNTVLAANTILQQMWTFAAFGIDGFAFAAESLVGRFIGARDRFHLRKIIKYLFGWMMGLSVVLSVAYGIFMETILFMFTDKDSVVQEALRYQWWTILTPIVSGFCYIWDGIFLGATDSKPLRNSMIFCSLVIFLPVFQLSRELLLNHALWLALFSFMIFRGLSLSYYAYKQYPAWIKND